METIYFPDVEALLVTHLNALVVPPVSTQVPNPRPATFVKVVRTGGPRQGLITDEAQVTFEAWADSTVAAAALARQVRAHVGALAGQRLAGNQVHRVRELSGPANLPDPTSGQARYTWSVMIDMRGHAI